MFSDNNTSACDLCYSYTLAECSDADSIVIQGSGLANGDYTWFVEDKFGHVYSGTATVESGNIAIPLDDFPEKFFTQYAGVFTIWFEQESTRQTITFNTVEYECIKIVFESITPAPEELIIK